MQELAPLLVRRLQGDELYEIDEEDEADPHHGGQHVQEADQEGEEAEGIGTGRHQPKEQDRRGEG